PADAAVLAELGATTFIETFGHLYTPEDLHTFLDESHTEAAYAKVLAADSPYALWLAERDGRVLAMGRDLAAL
ncbi:MAG TPA: GNAT family N-acetyltransferase, partial [Chiayiivirga sp.]|nr:GNAT family N-acetyltransferase [Chiayiivirga sp.]